MLNELASRATASIVAAVACWPRSGGHKIHALRLAVLPVNSVADYLSLFGDSAVLRAVIIAVTIARHCYLHDSMLQSFV